MIKEPSPARCCYNIHYLLAKIRNHHLAPTYLVINSKLTLELPWQLKRPVPNFL